MLQVIKAPPAQPLGGRVLAMVTQLSYVCVVNPSLPPPLPPPPPPGCHSRFPLRRLILSWSTTHRDLHRVIPVDRLGSRTS